MAGPPEVPAYNNNTFLEGDSKKNSINLFCQVLAVLHEPDKSLTEAGQFLDDLILQHQAGEQRN